MHIYLDSDFLGQILSLITEDDGSDYDIIFDASRCIRPLVKIHPNAMEWAQLQTHLIFLDLINEIKNDSTLSDLTLIGLEIISLMPDAEKQISLVNHGIIDALISITHKMNLDEKIFVFISKVICNISHCMDFAISIDDEPNDEPILLDMDITKYNGLMRLLDPCLQLGLGLGVSFEEEEEEDAFEEDQPNHVVLANSCKFMKNIVLLHDWPIMHHLPTKVWPEMISLLPKCVDQEMRDDIIAVFEGIIIKFNHYDVNRWINDVKLLDELQKIDQPIAGILRILSRLCRTNHATQIINDYPQLMTKIMNSLSSNSEIIIIKSMDCLNNLFENNDNYLLFTKTNCTELLCTFLLKEDCVSYTEEYHQNYITLYNNTLNVLKNLSDSNTMSPNTKKIWNKLSNRFSNEFVQKCE